jgi:RNA polymerase sigma-70 factor, ECF subfamily
MAVYYADIDGYRYAEAAALMNIALGTVMSRTFRGRPLLRVAVSPAARLRGYHHEPDQQLVA